MAVALQIAASGLAAGSVYGLVGVGNSLVFRLTGVVNLAFGELIALGVFTTLLVAAGSGPVSQTSVGGARFLLALVVGLVVTAAASAGSYFLAIEPYRARGSTIGWVAASLAVAFVIRTALVAFFDRAGLVFPDPLPFHRLGDDGFWHVGGATIQARSLFVAAAAFLLAAAAAACCSARARAGARGDLEDFDAAVLVGLPVGRSSGSHSPWRAPRRAWPPSWRRRPAAFDPDAAARYGLYGLLAAVVVWFDPRRAFFAGVVLGLVQATVTSTHWGGGPAYRDVLPLLVGLIVLAIRTRAPAEAAE